MTLRYGLAAVAVAMAVLIGVNYLGTSTVGSPGFGSSTPTPDPAAPTPSQTARGLLPEGEHVLSNGEAPQGETSLPMTVAIPAPDWYADPEGGILMKNDNADAPDGAGIIVFFGDLYVFGDPCEWETTRPGTAASTVDELVAALTAQESRDATEPVDVTVDGYTGKSITLRVPSDAVFGNCDKGTFRSWEGGTVAGPYRYHQDPGQIDRLWIVDVDGTLAVIDAAYYEGTPQSVIDEMEAIVESASFN